jgi:hypothetical protein
LIPEASWDKMENPDDQRLSGFLNRQINKTQSKM